MKVIDSNCGDGDSEACAHLHPPLQSEISTHTCSRSSSSSQSDILLNGLFVAATLSSSEIDLKVFDAVINEVMSLPIFTVVHVPSLFVHYWQKFFHRSFSCPLVMVLWVS